MYVVWTARVNVREVKICTTVIGVDSKSTTVVGNGICETQPKVVCDAAVYEELRLDVMLGGGGVDVAIDQLDRTIELTCSN